MRPPENFVRIVDRTRYDVSKAELLAGDDFWDGRNFERSGRQRFLYRTPRGNYFTVSLSQWQGEQDTLEPVDIDDAILLYEGPLSEHRVEYEAAFPDIEVVEAYPPDANTTTPVRPDKLGGCFYAPINCVLTTCDIV